MTRLLTLTAYAATILCMLGVGMYFVVLRDSGTDVRRDDVRCSSLTPDRKAQT